MSRKATSPSDSRTMSASISPATIPQNRQSVTATSSLSTSPRRWGPASPCIHSLETVGAQPRSPNGDELAQFSASLEPHTHIIIRLARTHSRSIDDSLVLDQDVEDFPEMSGQELLPDLVADRD